MPLTLLRTRELIIRQVWNRVLFKGQVLNRVSSLWSGHKQGRQNHRFWSKQGRGFGKHAAHPAQFFREYPQGGRGVGGREIGNQQAKVHQAAVPPMQCILPEYIRVPMESATTCPVRSTSMHEFIAVTLGF